QASFPYLENTKIVANKKKAILLRQPLFYTKFLFGWQCIYYIPLWHTTFTIGTFGQTTGRTYNKILFTICFVHGWYTLRVGTPYFFFPKHIAIIGVVSVNPTVAGSCKNQSRRRYHH